MQNSEEAFGVDLYSKEGTKDRFSHVGEVEFTFEEIADAVRSSRGKWINFGNGCYAKYNSVRNLLRKIGQRRD